MSNGYRLPGTVVPRSYEIDLEATPRRKTFKGTVNVQVRVLERTERIELNARDLKVDHVKVTARKKRLPCKPVLHPDKEMLSIELDRPLAKGAATVEIAYSGKLNPQMAGLYLGQTGRDKAIVSQCEAPHARAIFPCWDEPSYKATLLWTVRTDPGLTVITNGKLEKTRKSSKTGLVTHRFKKTRVLPTYLAAITIGRYEQAPTQRISGVPCTSYALGRRIEQVGFADEATAFALPWFVDYFQQKYHYQKLDQVAVPGFDAGAMENAGAIFYRQQLFLMEPGATSWSAQKEIAEVIAHEIAHQWFGNRVTMKWWDDLWLNEAFATWISNKLVDEWKPDWRIWDEFLGGRREALSRDALNTTHPVYSPVESPADAMEMFDAITYYKGSCVVRQVESYLGADTFREGLRDYIDRFKDGNAAGDDLWAALSRASGEDVTSLAHSWIRQSGFPLVSFELAGDGRTLQMSQRRFFSSAEAFEHADPQTWHVPVQVRFRAGGQTRTARMLLTEPEGELDLGAKVDWVYPNIESIGFYRCQLDTDLLKRLEQEGLKSLPASERQNHFEDQWNLVVVGLLGVDAFLDTLAAFAGETDYVVLRSISQRLSFLRDYLVPSSVADTFKRQVQRWFGPSLDQIGAPGESEGTLPERVARAELFQILGDIARDDSVLEHARRIAEQEREDPGSVEPNLAAVAIRLAALVGDAGRFDAFTSEYKRRVRKGYAPQLQSRYLHALSWFESDALVDKALTLSTDGTIPQEQLTSFFGGLFFRKSAQLRAWDFLKHQWEPIASRVGPMGLSRLVECPAALPADMRDEVQRFFASQSIEPARRALAQSLEAMANREELTSREQPRLKAWLQRVA